MVLAWLAPASGLALRELRVEPGLLVGLAELHAFHGVIRVVSLGEVASCGAACRVHHNALLGSLCCWRLHRVQARVVFRAYLSLHHLLRRHLLLALEAPWRRVLLEALANVKRWCSKVISILTFGCRLFP